MRLADMIHGFYKGAAVIIIETVNDLVTGETTTNEIALAADTAFEVLSYDQLYKSKVVMFEAVKKNTLKIWTNIDLA